MKFSDGYWRVREGFTAAWARQTHDIAKTDNGICAHLRIWSMGVGIP